MFENKEPEFVFLQQQLLLYFELIRIRLKNSLKFSEQKKKEIQNYNTEEENSKCQFNQDYYINCCLRNK